ncbi:YheC/YheD family protein [Paenibacillus polymyxa]|jgi:glutathione synthase/RimK-type ligase-like ATP-grasp enzyme|uniref:YheC/YheD family protein n=1 Tax=Paenibacillus TaxID=44249 RepID=UPI000D312ADD|nr:MULTISPECIES: YheC/YheD family protein [Paenibacillus]MDP9677958.1 glutathione synthase/RimK-type ligase-like ATP-grasp enzyme [Paenibacillus jamilae]KAF6583327.1 YheC/YheD family protein [Paenibacillus sp. EKM211P]KAF6655798.1 YheC/YheD family protein [Paenibacillus sp. EKM301P]MBE3647869.1 YheC/YheD family protein [Paenibacillus polymyxa]MBY0024813.1 YheC/YheD family protein [Paenibacillus polymyxa]
MRQLASKWLKTKALLHHPHTAVYIPETCLYSEEQLRIMLRRHAFVFIKPVKGGGGVGVMRVAKEGNGYTCTRMEQTYRFSHFRALVAGINKLRIQRPYLIQQGIQLASIQGRPVDYRVKVVKEGEKWEFRAVVARHARPGLVITNLCKGGTLLKGTEALRMIYPRRLARRKRREIVELTQHCIPILERRFPGIGQLGFDYGLDWNGRVWILEVNTRPQ